jgi:hypothetical protein
MGCGGGGIVNHGEACNYRNVPDFLHRTRIDEDIERRRMMKGVNAASSHRNKRFRATIPQHYRSSAAARVKPSRCGDVDDS